MWSVFLLIPLTSIPSGLSTNLDSVLKKTDYVLFIEEHCKPCELYVQSLASCHFKADKKIALVALGSESYLRTLSSSIGSHFHLYKTRKDIFKKHISATPTTLIDNQKVIGKLSCEKLHSLKEEYEKI